MGYPSQIDPGWHFIKLLQHLGAGLGRLCAAMINRDSAVINNYSQALRGSCGK